MHQGLGDTWIVGIRNGKVRSKDSKEDSHAFISVFSHPDLFAQDAEHVSKT